MRIAVLGLGLMGSEIALRLKRQGLETIGWNRGAERAEAARGRGLPVAHSVAEALAGAELVLLVLADAAAIRETLLDDPAASAAIAGRILVQMGTIAPAESRAIGEAVAGLGGRWLEAPVLGSLPEAREGRLIVMAGGDPGLFELCLPVLRVLGREPQLIGPLGQGAALKLAMNQLIGGLTATFALSLGLVRAEGIEVERFMGLLRQSALHARTFDKKLDRYLGGDYGDANFPLKHLLKDLRLFRGVAEGDGLDTAPVAALESACTRALDLGLGDLDYSALYESLSPRRPS
jgi:3-hydroxyisobutyrate dehydrogenase